VIFSKLNILRTAVEDIKKARDYQYQGLLRLEGAGRSQAGHIKPVTNFVYVEMEDSEFVYEELKTGPSSSGGWGIIS
jgi:hypothetical protein